MKAFAHHSYLAALMSLLAEKGHLDHAFIVKNVSDRDTLVELVDTVIGPQQRALFEDCIPSTLRVTTLDDALALGYLRIYMQDDGTVECAYVIACDWEIGQKSPSELEKIVAEFSFLDKGEGN